jgi:hypothetical protein
VGIKNILNQKKGIYFLKNHQIFKAFQFKEKKIK